MDITNRAGQDVTRTDKDRNSRLRLSAHENVATEKADAVINQTASNCGNECHIPDSSASLGEQIEVIKVYLESCSQGQDKDQSVIMFNGDMSQIQEVRYCLKTLREQMAARYKNNSQLPAGGIRVDVPVSKSLVSSTTVDGAVSESQNLECVKLRELTNHLYSQLQEMEKRHQEEKEALQAENREHLKRLKEQNERVQQAQTEVQVKYQRSKELERLLGDLKLENTSLREKMAVCEPELQELRQQKDKDDGKRCQQLEKELAVQKEKNHHLDDMLKSQQRKVRHMIEQLQNSRTLMQERERLIGDLQEKVAFLEAENRELHDQMECSLEDKSHSSKFLEKDAEIVYSKPLTPTSPGNKSLPFIKVIEIKS